ncbi:MAG: 50S ribosomal protein L24 [Candidatus Hydrogenedentes bacterium]|nr:50S ribosomal protein L24 [Candidatus Hydrogenedentota bacterium]
MYSRRKHEQDQKSAPKMNIRTGDIVLVRCGKDRGKTGKVLRVYRKKKMVLVQSVNFMKRHTRPSQRNQQGGVVEREAPLAVSNVMLVCDKCSRATRVDNVFLEDGSKARRCKKCNEVIGR